MYIKIHHSYRRLAAICDEELLGKIFEEGKKILDVRESFYKGESVNEDKVIEMMLFNAREDATFNIVGKESIAAAIKAGIIDGDTLGTVQGIPFVLVLL